MTRIRILDQQTANSIAAGEVVERPASVVKELVENALDADASAVTVDIAQGGIKRIRVIDNGGGMDAEDALLAFGRHATSKLARIEDLDQLSTMGFRGEALASIAAVARVTLETRQPGRPEGTKVSLAAGELIEQGPVGCAEGTTVTVEHLFANVPARFKFLRKDATEAGQVGELMERLALARPDVSFRLISNQQEIMHTPGNNDLLSTVFAVYGRQTAQACLPVVGECSPVRVTGLVGRPESARNNRQQQSFFVNGRLVRARAISAALEDAYKTFLMKGKYAVAILYLDVPPQLVDVNVHPQKMEVRFWNDQEIFRCVYHAVLNALTEQGGILPADGGQAPDQTSVSGEGLNEGGAAEADGTPVYRQPALILRDSGEDQALPAVRTAVPAAAPGPADAADGQRETGPAEPGQSAGLSGPSAFSDPERPSAARTGGQDLVTVHDLARARYIGQLFQTYLLLELDADLLLIDQHAAHEKILFERLVDHHRQMAAGDEKWRQDLLAPVVIEVSPSDLQALQAEQDTLLDLGFSYTVFGATAVAIRTLPAAGNLSLQPEAAFRAALAAIRQDVLNSEDGISELYFSVACKAAVKAHDHLDEQEVRQLLVDLRKLEHPYQCPHGRPVIIRLPRHELEKRFKRIV